MGEKSGDTGTEGGEYYANPDRPTSEDKLGFEPYVSAVKHFLTHEKTDPPLTISIEGDWGAGKSSFLSQLEEEFSDEYTIQFNPWRHDEIEQLWAAFAIQFFEQLSSQVGWFQRWKGHILLYLRRARWENGILKIARDIFLTLASIVAVVCAPLLLLAFLSQTQILVSGSGSSIFGIGVIDTLLGTGGVALSLAGLLTVCVQVRREIRDTVKSEISSYISQPNYQDRIPFIENFHQDFDRMVESYVHEEPVYIFIDDLDRCESPRAADLMKGINMLVSGDTNVFFAIAMDREKVASSIAVKHSDMLDHFERQQDHRNGETVQTKEMGFGYRYTEKFIEIPFQVPGPASEDVARFVRSLSQISDPSQNSIDSWRQSNSEPYDFTRRLNKVTATISSTFQNNPRKIKKFVNLFRLQTLLAKERGILDRKRGTGFGITLEQLGKFVALSLQFPHLVSYLSSDPAALRDLQEYALSDRETNISNSLKEWASDKSLISLLIAGCDSEASNDPYSFEYANVEFLLQISPESDHIFSEGQRITVRVQESIGEILGIDGRTYHLQKSDLVSLPASNAIPLLEKDAASLPQESSTPSSIRSISDLEILDPSTQDYTVEQEERSEIRVHALEDVGEISAVDGKTYTLNNGDTVRLPAPTAVPLLERGQVEEVPN